MATGEGESFNPAYETFRKHSADLLTAIQDPEVLAWELYAKDIIPSAVRDAVNNMMHERSKRTSDLLAAVDSRIAVDPGAFNVFQYVLAKRPSMSNLCESVKETYRRSVGQAHISPFSPPLYLLLLSPFSSLPPLLSLPLPLPLPFPLLFPPPFPFSLLLPFIGLTPLLDVHKTIVYISLLT